MTQYQADPMQTGISLAYTNKEYIADLIFKRVPTTVKNFSYLQYQKSLNLQLPDTEVGPKGEPNTVDFKGEKKYAETRSDALIDDIPQTDIDEANGESENLLTTSTTMLTNVFLGAREQRLAKLLENVNNYGSNYQDISSSNRISNDSVDAFKLIDNAAQQVWIKPNVMIGGRSAINALRRNPYIVKAANHNSGDTGKATIEDLKDMFELDRIYIGNSMANLSKRGQAASYVNTWGNCIILAYIDPTADLKHGLTFGLTAELGKREISNFYDPRRGVRGVLSNKIAEQIQDVIVAPECGYLLKNVA